MPIQPQAGALPPIPDALRKPDPNDLRTIGIIDLGSNTARLVVFECSGRQSYRMIDSVRERVRLAEGLNRDGTLNRAAIDRALAAMELSQMVVQARWVWER